jgi:hypothetical protein
MGESGLAPVGVLDGKSGAVRNRRLAVQARWFRAGNHRHYFAGHMITGDAELQTTLDQVTKFQRQVAHLRVVETNPANYHASASGFLAEIDRMQLEVREYLSSHPLELSKAV